MSVSEQEQKIAKNKQRISEIDVLLNQGEYETVEKAQELRLESQRLKDGIPLLEKEVEKIKALQRNKALEVARRRLKLIVKEGNAIQLKILKIQVDLLRKVTRLKILYGKVHSLAHLFKELAPLIPGFHLANDKELLDFVRAEPHVSPKLWKKIESEWREAYKEYRRRE